MATIERARATFLQPVPDGIEIGRFAPAISRETTRSSLIIVSYNIRYAAGSSLISGSIARRLGLSRQSRRPQLVRRNLRKAARTLSDGQLLPRADIVALQEADKLTARAGRHHIARELASELRMHYARAAAAGSQAETPKSKEWYLDFEEEIPVTDTGDTGIAILSRFPLERVQRVELPWSECAWRPRLALSATVQAGDHQMRIFNSHIDPHAQIKGQLEQHSAILERADDWIGPAVLLGDFNTLSRASCHEMRRLLESHQFTTPFPTRTGTWRSGPVRLHTDWIFVRGARVKRSGVARRPGVSDHWPVWVELDLENETVSG